MTFKPLSRRVWLMADGSEKDDAVESFTLRIPRSVLAKVERIADELRKTNPLAEHVSRNVLIVVLINAGADALSTEAA